MYLVNKDDNTRFENWKVPGGLKSPKNKLQQSLKAEPLWGTGGLLSPCQPPSRKNVGLRMQKLNCFAHLTTNVAFSLPYFLISCILRIRC